MLEKSKACSGFFHNIIMYKIITLNYDTNNKKKRYTINIKHIFIIETVKIGNAIIDSLKYLT